MIRKLVIWAFNKQTQQLRDIVGIDVNQYDYGYLIIMTKVQGTDRVKVIPIPPALTPLPGPSQKHFRVAVDLIKRMEDLIEKQSVTIKNIKMDCARIIDENTELNSQIRVLIRDRDSTIKKVENLQSYTPSLSKYEDQL